MKYDLVVVGSGPGGYVAAIRASQLGMKTAVIERAELGGICLNWGCIPTKSLMKSAQVLDYVKHTEEYGVKVEGATADFEGIVKRSRGVADKMSGGIQYLFKKNKIDVINGFGKLKSKGVVTVTNDKDETQDVEAKHIIIATGARSRELPNLPQDGEKVIGYRQALTLKKMPKSMLVVGSGAIGSEFAYFYASMGAKVTLVEYLPNIVPLEDEEVSKQLGRSFKKMGIKVMTNSSVESLDTSGDLVKAQVKNKKGEMEEHEAEIVLSAVGIAPNTENIGLDELGIETERGRIKVNDHYETNVEGIYAIGDVIETAALAHVASAEGIHCVETIAGEKPEKIDYTNIPGCIYTSPEVASVGMTEKKAKEEGYEIKVGKFPFSASGKASAAGANEGFVKLIFDAKYGELLGAHMIGANVTEMIAELVLARKLETTGHEIIKAIHPHPTMSEAVMEAAAAAYDEVIHI
ncbi:dihydrolipoamide dehydrogenase [Balneicella halophila]|uniref:Dihydrolipoyl dehydrogenase n=1 Tax=Balneicella halophila TaxID=1537566 RepID=A0A7L4UMY8_BALHA|nr:dihydrolipoyl dehydrogenase [Balneicella halophila]PVX49835.1 dihydrolipoamide dehydrogenase [Balneicella halophila]